MSKPTKIDKAREDFAVFTKCLLAVPKQEVKDLEGKAQKPKTRRKPKG